MAYATARSFAGRHMAAGLTNTQVRCLQKAWSAGRPQGNPSKKLTELPQWRRGIQEDFSEEQRKRVQQVVYYVGKARQFAAQGDYDASIQLFGVAQKLMADAELERCAYLLCVSEAQAAEAYLDFTTGDFAGAKKRLGLAMAADQAMEEEFEHSVLHIHRVHLVNNTVKVEAGAQNLAGALSLAANVLEYTAGAADFINVAGQWGGKWRSALTEEPQQFLYKQTTAEVACAMAGVCDAMTRQAWTQCFGACDAAFRLQVPREIAAWYDLKSCFMTPAVPRRGKRSRSLSGWLLSFLQRVLATASCSGI